MRADNVIRKERSFKCRHAKYIVDEALAQVRCGQCDEMLNPIWVLTQFIGTDNSYHRQLKGLQNLAKKADKKNKCKCEHCNKMTKIQRG